jgi:DNA-binding MarR family transcriptional regulator
MTSGSAPPTPPTVPSGSAPPTPPTVPDRPIPAIPLARLFTMAARSLTDELHVRLRARGWPDIPPATGYVLLACRDSPTTGNEIAALMRTSRQAASKLLEGLEAAGLVERRTDDADTRRKVVALSARGRDLLAAVEEIYVELEREWADVLGAPAVEETRARVTRALLHVYGGRLPAIGPNVGVSGGAGRPGRAARSR